MRRLLWLWRQYWRFQFDADYLICSTPLFSLLISDGAPDWGTTGVPRYGRFYGIALFWLPSYWNVLKAREWECGGYRHYKVWQMRFVGGL